MPWTGYWVTVKGCLCHIEEGSFTFLWLSACQHTILGSFQDVCEGRVCLTPPTPSVSATIIQLNLGAKQAKKSQTKVKLEVCVGLSQVAVCV